MLFLLSIKDLEPILIFALLVAYFIAICIGMGFHEWAHSYAAYKSGDSTPKAMGRLTLNPFAHFSGMGLLMFFLIGFGWAKPVQINPTNFRNYKKGMLWTSISGVLTNLIIAFVASGLLMLFNYLSIVNAWDIMDNVLLFFVQYLLYYTVMINLILFVFNLLPIPPLDGYNFISVFTKYNNRVMSWLQQYAFLIIILLILPIFNGSSILGLFYDVVIGWIMNVFGLFWGLFF